MDKTPEKALLGESRPSKLLIPDDDAELQPPEGLSKNQRKKWIKDQKYKRKQREKQLRQQKLLQEKANRMNQLISQNSSTSNTSPNHESASLSVPATQQQQTQPLDLQSMQSLHSMQSTQSHLNNSPKSSATVNTSKTVKKPKPISVGSNKSTNSNANNPTVTNVNTPNVSNTSNTKKKGNKSKKARQKTLPQYDDPATRNRLRKQAIAHRISVANEKQSKLFAHLPQLEKELHISMKMSQNIHPSIIGLGIYYANGIISGANGRTVTLFKALKDMISSYECDSDQTFSRELMKELNPCIQFLVDCRPQAIAMGNAIKVLKNFIRNVSPEMPASDVCRLVLYMYVCDVSFVVLFFIINIFALQILAL